MNDNEVDKFRIKFFDNLVKEEKEKEKARIMTQKNCPHNYNLRGVITQTGYQERTCSKCGHSAFKSIKVWEYNNYNKCIIS